MGLLTAAGAAVSAAQPDNATGTAPGPTNATPEPVPLVVDLDGTLLHTDTLVESLFALARQRPLQLLGLPRWLLAGRAVLKRELARRSALDVALLPLGEDVLAYLRAQHRQGRSLVLATAADAQIAAAVAARLGLFDTVLASDGRTNLSGAAKRDRLVATFGHRGYDYIGDSRCDLPVWAAARRALLVRPTAALALRVARCGTAIERRFDAGRTHARDYLDAMRWQHGLKNLLLFVPLFLPLFVPLPDQRPLEQPARLAAAALGCVAFSLVASGVYLLNDLFDLAADRCHPHKQTRALASGRLPLVHALLLVPMLWLAASALALALPRPFLGVLAAYAVLMVLYSVRLKDWPFVDALVLGVGYSLRIVAGAVAVGVAAPAWLLGCSTGLFFGLALLKRYAELVTLRPRLGLAGSVRGYATAHAGRVAVLGAAASALALLLLALGPPFVQRSPWPGNAWLPSATGLLWTAHMWRMAHLGRIPDDPVAFALRDGPSRALGVATALLLLPW